jgi:hypothetical protein
MKSEKAMMNPHISERAAVRMSRQRTTRGIIKIFEHHPPSIKMSRVRSQFSASKRLFQLLYSSEFGMNSLHNQMALFLTLRNTYKKISSKPYNNA